MEANISIARDEATRNRTYIRTDRIKDRGAKVNGEAICNIFYIFVTHLSDVSTKMMNVRDPIWILTIKNLSFVSINFKLKKVLNSSFFLKK